MKPEESEICSKTVRPLIVGISGGSCSGKTTLARHLSQFLGKETCSVIFQDNYYRDFSSFIREGKEINFDHPGSLDFDLLSLHLKQLKEGRSIEVPLYDFVTHSRLPESVTFIARPIIFVDGILIFTQPHIREWLDYLFFVDAKEEIRFERRRKRDVAERGRTLEFVEKQLSRYVKPMHDTFVEPSKIYADEILNGCVDVRESLQFLLKVIGGENELLFTSSRFNQSDNSRADF